MWVSNTHSEVLIQAHGEIHSPFASRQYPENLGCLKAHHVIRIVECPDTVPHRITAVLLKCFLIRHAGCIL